MSLLLLTWILWLVLAGIEVRLRLFPFSEWPAEECLLLIRALFELLNEDEVGRWDLVFILEHPDIAAITEGEENQENDEAIENSSSLVFSVDSPEVIVIEDDDDDDNNAADAVSVVADAATNATGEVCTAGEQRDVNPDDNPATVPLRQMSGEEAEGRQCWEESWDFESDSGNADSSSAKDSDDDNPLPGPSSKWTPRDEQQSLISYQSTSTEDSEEECGSSLPWKKTTNAEEESLECPHNSFEDNNDSEDEPLPGPSRKRRRDRAEGEIRGN